MTGPQGLTGGSEEPREPVTPTREVGESQGQPTLNDNTDTTKEPEAEDTRIPRDQESFDQGVKRQSTLTIANQKADTQETGLINYEDLTSGESDQSSGEEWKPTQGPSSKREDRSADFGNFDLRGTTFRALKPQYITTFFSFCFFPDERKSTSGQLKKESRRL